MARIMLGKHDREQIDACRHGTNDLHFPEFADMAGRMSNDPQLREAFDRAQSLDAALGRAIRNVPVPDQLEGRLLSALSEEPAPRLPVNPTDLQQNPEHETLIFPENAEAKQHRSTHVDQPTAWRRRMMISAVAASLLLMLFVIRWFGGDTPVSVESLFAYATDLRENVNGGWQPLDSAPVGYEASATLLWPERTWKPARSEFDKSAVVFNLAGPTQPTAVLFVLRSKRNFGLGSHPKRSSYEGTGGWSMVAWQEGSIVYVLMVRGSRERLESLVQEPNSVARHFPLSRLQMRG